jgi:hypothetical protein
LIYINGINQFFNNFNTINKKGQIHVIVNLSFFIFIVQLYYILLIQHLLFSSS